MLQRIHLHQLGVIEDAELELSPGLNVITGETGAGKTMVVTGLGLLLGARADPDLVRTGAERAVVEGEIDVPADHPAAQRVRAAGGDAQEGIVVVRTLTAGGRSRAHVGGRAAPVGVLAEVGALLVAVHGQADQWRLREPAQHRQLLDDVGGAPVAAARAVYTEAYDVWRAAAERLRAVAEAGADQARQAEMLRSALAAIHSVDPQPGEEDELALEADRLAHADALRGGAEGAHAALSGFEDLPGPDGPASAVELIGQAAKALSHVSEHDPALDSLRRRVEEVGYLVSDIAAELASYTAAVDVDPARLAQVQERQAAIAALLRSYGPDTEAVLAWAGESATVLAELDTSPERLAQLRAEVDDAVTRVMELGQALSRLRRASAEQLQGAVAEELTHLAMGSARVEVAVQTGALAEDAHRDGLDEVEIRLAANPGTPARSITRAASGGELSRVMLALEVVGSRGDVPTYVFDEVDAGVGGSAALDLGARLARLAEHAQVVVVTHLGQVAAYADHHLVVRKSSSGAVTSSDVQPVTGAEREAEVARMLGGVSDSDAALRHARELLVRRGTMGRR